MATEIQTCYRHPDRRAGVTCQRCNRPICPNCMVPASVGFHCPECARSGQQRVYTPRTLFRSNKPVVTMTLIGINVAVFLIDLATGANAMSGDGGKLTDNFGLVGSACNQGLNTSNGVICTHLVGVAHGEWYRLITGGFLHAGFLHIAFNMFALWILGSQIEMALGRVRFFTIYAVSLLAGSLGVMILSPHEFTVGASGAIFGLLGAAVAVQKSMGINIWQSGIITILAINLLFTFGVPGISIGGHLGGLVGGFICGFIVYELAQRMQNPVLPIALCAAIGVACFYAAIVVANANAYSLT
jgi:membrane associated rhomboid family serine protease